MRPLESSFEFLEANREETRHTRCLVHLGCFIETLQKRGFLTINESVELTQRVANLVHDMERRSHHVAQSA